MIKVSVKSTEVRNQSGNSKSTGKPYSLNFQQCYFHLVDKHGNPEPYPTKVEIILPTNTDGAALYYPVGEYTLAPESVYVSRTGDIAMSPRLRPLQAKPAEAKV